jgi:addiction module RelE/StbE family toxin
LPSSSFIRAVKKVTKRGPQVAEDVKQTLTLLEEDVFHPGLKTHKLKGILEGSWACSVAYDLRIVFEIVQFEGEEAILLQTIGTHDEVY